MDEQKSVKAVLFDLDGTLVNLPINYDRVRERLKELFTRYHLDSEFKPLVQSIETCLKELKTKNFQDDKIEKIRKLAYDVVDEEELRAVKSSRLIPGSKEILAFAKKRNLFIAIFTRNGSKCTQEVFKKYRLPRPQIIASRDRVEKLKPEKEHVLYILDKLQLSAEECVIVGDSIHDVSAGKELNIKAILLRDTNGNQK